MKIMHRTGYNLDTKSQFTILLGIDGKLLEKAFKTCFPCVLML